MFTDIPIVSHCGSTFWGLFRQDSGDQRRYLFSLRISKNFSFNSAARSNLKYSQMTLMKSAFVATNYGPYSTIDHGIDGMLVNSENDWVKHISHTL